MHTLIDKLDVLKKMRVLLVEDSPDNQMLVTRKLQNNGIDVTVASNGRQAIQAIESNEPFDVVLMDLQMPEMDGFAAVTALRQKNYTKPIIALTAHAMKEERDHCLANGFNDHVCKPIDFPELFKKLAHFGSPRTSHSKEKYKNSGDLKENTVN